MAASGGHIEVMKFLQSKDVDINATDKVFKVTYSLTFLRGWSGGGMVLGKLPVPGPLAYLDYSRARASTLAVGVSTGWMDIFFSHL